MSIDIFGALLSLSLSVPILNSKSQKSAQYGNVDLRTSI